MTATTELAWSTELSVGVDALDAQHRGLIHLINRFGREPIEMEEMAALLEKVIAYAARHFNDEEDWLLANAPHLLEHQIECHCRFITQAYEFADRFQCGEDVELRDRVHSFLCDWLQRHIREEDQRYCPARRAAGAL